MPTTRFDVAKLTPYTYPTIVRQAAIFGVDLKNSLQMKLGKTVLNGTSYYVIVEWPEGPTTKTTRPLSHTVITGEEFEKSWRYGRIPEQIYFPVHRI